MNPHVASLELSQELKSLGMKQEGVWWWNNFDVPIHFNSKFKYGCDPKGKKSNMGFHLVDKHTINHRKTIPTITNFVYCTAPTVGELGDILPEGYFTMFDGQGWYAHKEDPMSFKFFPIMGIHDETEANCRAKLVIAFCKHNLWKFKEGKLEVL